VTTCSGHYPVHSRPPVITSGNYGAWATLVGGTGRAAVPDRLEGHDAPRAAARAATRVSKSE